jgi:hypothetical protein
MVFLSREVAPVFTDRIFIVNRQRFLAYEKG